MDLNRIAARVARSVRADEGFTVCRPLKLKSEGSTRVSLENAKAILDAGYSIRSAFFVGQRLLEVEFFRDEEEAWHTFKGFTVGYNGEGPRGMIEFFEMFGKWVDPDKVKSPLPELSNAFDPMKVFA